MEDWKITIIDRAENVLKLRHRELLATCFMFAFAVQDWTFRITFVFQAFFFFFVLYGLYSSVYGLDFWTPLKVYIC